MIVLAPHPPGYYSPAAVPEGDGKQLGQGSLPLVRKRRDKPACSQLREGLEDSDPFTVTADARPPPTWPSCPSLESWRHHERPRPGPPPSAAASHRTQRPGHLAAPRAQLQKPRWPSAPGSGCQSGQLSARTEGSDPGHRTARAATGLEARIAARLRPRPVSQTGHAHFWPNTSCPLLAKQQAPPPARQSARPHPRAVDQPRPNQLAS